MGSLRHCVCPVRSQQSVSGVPLTPEQIIPVFGIKCHEPWSAAGVGGNTVNRFEAGQDARVSSVDTMRTARESAGVEFIPENGGGAGVRLAKPRPQADQLPEGEAGIIDNNKM